MTDNRNLLAITPEEKQDLEGWAQSRTLPAGDVFRARLLLALAAGNSHRRVLVIGRLSELGNARLGMHCTQSCGSGRPHFRLLVSKGLFCHLSCSGIFREQA